MVLGDGLTSREREILALVALGWRNAQIARELCISSATVENHLHHIFSKLGVSTRTEAAMYALRVGVAGGKRMKDFLQDGRAHTRYLIA